MTRPVKRVDQIAEFRYADSAVPEAYRCGGCGAHGVRLWRLYQTFLDRQSLTCAKCSCEHQGPGYSVRIAADANARVTRVDSSGTTEAYGDQIGWRIPAVPTESGKTFWGYTDVPQDGVTWWNRLPLEIIP